MNALRFVASAIGTLTVASVACRGSNSPPAPQTVSRVLAVACIDARRLAPAVGPNRAGGAAGLSGLRAQLVGLSRTVPGGFAGLKRPPASREVGIQLTDTSQVERVRAALLELLSTQPSALVPALSDQLARAAPIQVRWSLAELHDWNVFLEDTLPRFAYKTGGDYRMWGVDESANRVFFAAPDSASQRGLVLALGQLTLPCDLVITEVRPMSSAP